MKTLRLLVIFLCLSSSAHAFSKPVDCERKVSNFGNVLKELEASEKTLRATVAKATGLLVAGRATAAEVGPLKNDYDNVINRLDKFSTIQSKKISDWTPAQLPELKSPLATELKSFCAGQKNERCEVEIAVVGPTISIHWAEIVPLLQRLEFAFAVIDGRDSNQMKQTAKIFEGDAGRGSPLPKQQDDLTVRLQRLCQ